MMLLYTPLYLKMIVTSYCTQLLRLRSKFISGIMKNAQNNDQEKISIYHIQTTVLQVEVVYV